jgi:hypothetical protein
MFVNAIKDLTKFTRPMQTISRAYGHKEIIPGLSTLFFVNENGVAITCKHVAQLIISADPTNQQFNQFRTERDQLAKDGKYQRNVKGLELKYKYQKDTTIQIKNNFVGAVDHLKEITVHQHKTYDLAIVQLKGYNQIHYESFARFLKDTSKIEQGKYLCRLGYPFPEYANYKYDPTTDDILFDNSKQANVPIFPIDGIITRNIAENNELMGIEMSTPGLRGQSGGPLFDENGIIYGMQQSTKHLHLGFDIENKEILVNGMKKKIHDYAFLHLGQCLRVDIIKQFLDEHNIKYYEEE